MLEHDYKNCKTAPTQPCSNGRSLPDILTSKELFGDNKLIIIRHSGSEYRLSVTSKDKLILTK